MYLRIENIEEKKMIGMNLRMSFANNRTFELWSSFMPRRNEIMNKLNTHLYSLQNYPVNFDFSQFDPTVEFEKYAAVEVSDHNSIPDKMIGFIIPKGLYAVFLHKGPASEAPRTFGYIFSEWMPQSGYSADSRPHFEILGEKYKNNDPDSEEEVWIPVKKL